MQQQLCLKIPKYVKTSTAWKAVVYLEYGCGTGTQISGSGFNCSSRHRILLAPAPTATSKAFWHRFQKHLVQWKLKTIAGLLFLQLCYYSSTYRVLQNEFVEFHSHFQFVEFLPISFYFPFTKVSSTAKRWNFYSFSNDMSIGHLKSLDHGRVKSRLASFVTKTHIL